MDVTRTALAERLAGSSDRLREVADQLAERSEGVRELAEHLAHGPEGLRDITDRLAVRSDGLRELAEHAVHIDLGDRVHMPTLAWPGAPAIPAVPAIPAGAAAWAHLRRRVERLLPTRGGRSRRDLVGILALVGVALVMAVGATGAAFLLRRRARRARRRAERQAARNGMARRGAGGGGEAARRPGTPLVAVPIGAPPAGAVAPERVPAATGAGQPVPTPAAEEAPRGEVTSAPLETEADMTDGGDQDADSSAAPLEAEVASASDDTGDGLRAIRGLGAVSEERLRELGISSCRQVADWTPEDVRAIAERIRVSPERIEREDWVGQARRVTEGLEAARPQAS